MARENVNLDFRFKKKMKQEIIFQKNQNIMS